MSLEQELKNDGKCRVTYDTENPRINVTEWKCAGCGAWVNDEEVVWAHDDGTLSTTDKESKPWCDGCLPPEPDYYRTGEVDAEIPERILSQDGESVGTPGEWVRTCTMESCGGYELEVKWPDGERTWCCLRGLNWNSETEAQIP